MLSRTGLFDDMLAPDASAPSDVPVLRVGDLPLALGASCSGTPLRLYPLVDRVAKMKTRLAALGPPPYIGAAWRAGMPSCVGAQRLNKEIPPRLLGTALTGVAGTVVSVQRRPGDCELAEMAAAAGRPIHDLSEV